MMRTVFPNKMVAHVWAQQEQANGHSNNLSFSGETLYSYGTPIARIVKARNGQRVCLLTSASYSVTTSAHCSHAHSAFGYAAPVFRVPSLGVSAGRHRDDPSINHRRNLAHLVEQYNAERMRLRRAQRLWQGVREYLYPLARDVEAYAEAFRLKSRVTLADDVAEVEAYRETAAAKRNTPAAVAKRARAAEAREKREAEAQRIAQLASEERIALWMAGAPVSLRYNETRDAEGSAYLRIVRDEVQTSMGATVPLEHARQAFEFVKRCRTGQHAWQTNGETLRVGLFQVNRIDAQGNLWAGCHYVKYAEAERVMGAV